MVQNGWTCVPAPLSEHPAPPTYRNGATAYADVPVTATVTADTAATTARAAAIRKTDRFWTLLTPEGCDTAAS
jgi:hypothetical protein